MSGLIETATGDSVMLDVISATEAHGVNSDGDVVFVLKVNAATGELELAQYRAVQHNNWREDCGPGVSTGM